MNSVYDNRYFSHIDGLRALAVMVVLFFHFETPGFASGFLGVDIFFTISGFLITRLILLELRKTGKVDFKRFFVRRIRRLFPALLATCLFTGAFAYFILGPERLAAFGNSIAAAVISLSNIQFWMGSGYFDSASHTKPLLHTWSLSVEEQFYLVWPLTLFFCYKLFKEKTLSIVTFVGFFLSVSLIAIWHFGKFDARATSTIFYWMPFRVYEFMLGAFALLIFDRVKGHWWIPGTILMLATILLSADLSPEYGPILGFLACLGAVMVIISPNPFYAMPIFRWLGKVSYSLYLVHWPLWVFFPEDLKHLPFMWVALIGISLVLAWLLYEGVENRFRRGSAPIYRWAIASAAVIGSGLFIANATHLPFRKAATLTAAQIEAGKKNRFQVDKCSILGGDNCDMTRAKQVLIIGNSHEVDGYNIFHELYKNDDTVNLIAFGNMNNCEPFFEGQNIKSNVTARNCKDRVAALNDVQITHVVYAANLPYQKRKSFFWRYLKQADQRGAEVIVIGGFLNLTEHCSDLVNQFNSLEVCINPEYRSIFPKEEVENTQIKIDFDYLYLDRISTLCNRKLSQCPPIGYGEPLMYDKNHLSYGYAELTAEKLKTTYLNALNDIGLPITQ